MGQPAPAFTATDTSGKTVRLADFKGKTVVLEWVNPGCPFVRKHYDGGNMQSTQQAASDQKVVWLAINSTHDESADHKTPAAMAQWMSEHKAAARTADIATATNHVKAALAELAQGKPVSVPLTQPYGCSVKYRVS